MHILQSNKKNIKKSEKRSRKYEKICTLGKANHQPPIFHKSTASKMQVSVLVPGKPNPTQMQLIYLSHSMLISFWTLMDLSYRAFFIKKIGMFCSKHPGMLFNNEKNNFLIDFNLFHFSCPSNCLLHVNHSVLQTID